MIYGASAVAMLGLSGMMLYKSKAKSMRPLIESCILSIDQGTTSSRVLVIDHNLKVLDVAQREHNQISMKPGWVEHDVEEIYQNVAACLNEVC
jgi:glycerol kinase